MFFNRFFYLSFCILTFSSLTSMEVKVFNVGQGSCAVVTYPGQPSLLVDAGSDQIPNQKSGIISNIVAHLQQHSQNGICVLISHPEKDHAGWIQKIISKLPAGFVRNVTVGGVKESYSKFLPVDWLPHLFDSNSVTCRKPSHLPPYCTLWHAGHNQLKTNDQSLIVSVEDDNFQVILPGDSGSNTFNQNTVAASNKPTYLLASHHGSDKEGASNPCVLRLLAAKEKINTVVSSGMHGRYFHPTFKAISDFSQVTIPRVTSHYINCETPHNLTGTEQTQTVINYAGKFSVCRTEYPIYTTNNMGDITISWQGVSVSEPQTDIITTLNRKYFNNFNFDSIKHLFLTRMGISDTHVQCLTRLPVALRYFDLEHNVISARGFVRLLSLLQAHSGHTVIKTRENNSTDINTLRPMLEPSNGTHAQSMVKLNWNTILGYRSLLGEQVSQLNTIVSTPKTVDCQSEVPWALNFEQMNTCLGIERSQGAQSYSTELFYSEPEMFFHHANKTQWRSSLNAFKPLELHHPGVMIKAGWHKKNNFFLSDGNLTHIFEGSLYKNFVWGSPFVTAPIPDQKTGINHVTTCPSNGTGERELANLGWFRFGTVQPISKDGAALVTIYNGNTLLIHKKNNNGVFIQVASHSFPNIKSAGFCDADQSINMEFTDGTEKLLPLIMETI